MLQTTLDLNVQQEEKQFETNHRVFASTTQGFNRAQDLQHSEIKVKNLGQLPPLFPITALNLKKEPVQIIEIDESQFHEVEDLITKYRDKGQSNEEVVKSLPDNSKITSSLNHIEGHSLLPVHLQEFNTVDIQ